MLKNEIFRLKKESKLDVELIDNTEEFADEEEFINNFFIQEKNSQDRAKVYANYTGRSETFTYAKITAKIQKHVFLFIWTDVAVNENNQWVVYSTNVDDNIRLTHQLTSTGTYRAVITAEFYGTTGVTDTLNKTIECQY